MNKDARQGGNKAAGIKEIAKALNVSIGTVDRALHGRPGINSMTRAKVLKMAQTIGYRPNLAARYLKSRRQFVIFVQLPLHVGYFFDPLREGIRETAAPFEPGVRVDFQSYPALGEGDAELFEQALNQKVNGLIITPGAPALIKPLIRRAARRNIPVVCVGSDAPGTERLCCVSACPWSSGAVAAELLTRFVQGPGKAAFFTGSLGTEDHAEKLEGFRSSLQMLDSPLELLTPLESHDDEDRALQQTRQLLAREKDIRALYVSTANSLPVLQAIEEAGFSGNIAVITTDLFPALVPLIRSGRILATMHQRAFTLGRLAFQAVQQFLVEGKCPQHRIRIAPHIVMSGNLDLFVERLSNVVDEPESAGVP
jgi:LacI family transcriptional regulator, galactose operon repressor